MSAARKRLRVQHSEKADWTKEDWYVSNVKDCVGPYYVEVPVGKFFLNLIHMVHKICNIFGTSSNKKELCQSIVETGKKAMPNF